MRVVRETLKRLSVGEPQTFRNLTMFPLIRRGRPGRRYSLLEDVLEIGKAQITEVAPAGQVPMVLLSNFGDCPVLLLDGQELIGAMQDRALNVSVLAPPHAEIMLPVSCVEAARWEPVSPDFRAAPYVQFATVRASRTAQVTDALQTEGQPVSDQVEVWAEIDERAMRLNMFSRTRAHAMLFASCRDVLDSFVASFGAAANQVGSLFAIGNKIVGFDCFDSAETMRRCLSKLVRSAALDAIVSPDRCPPTIEHAEAFVCATGSARMLRFAGVGLGDDVRLLSDEIAGGALVYNDVAIHTSAFAMPQMRLCEREWEAASAV